MVKKFSMKRVGMCLLWLSVIFTSCKKEDTKPLPAPEALTASTLFALKVVLSWDAVTGAEEYVIYRADYASDTTGLVYEQVGVASASAYEDFTVISQSQYYYTVAAKNGSKLSAKSQPILGKTVVLTTDEAFNTLAALTGGERFDVASAAQLPGIIIEVIDKHAKIGTDLVFLIDNTGSMSDEIYQVKQSLSNIISRLPAGTRLGAALYNDLNVEPINWYQWIDLNSNLTPATSFIQNISLDGGGDLPESVYDGIYATIEKMSWSSTAKRMIIVIGDAPPLEGNKTVHSLMDVVNKCLEMDVAANLYPLLVK